jgi:uncharacterized protein (TIGR00255 family)
MALQSMTGHGEGKRTVDGVVCIIEVRGVNNRYLDIVVRGEGVDGGLVQAVQKAVGLCIQRGRVDVSVRLVFETAGDGPVKVDRNRVEGLLREYQRTFEHCAVPFDSSETARQMLLQILGRHDVFLAREELQERDRDDLVLETLDEALGQFIQSRTIEGERLGRDIQDRSEKLRDHLSHLKDISSTVVERARERLRQRIARAVEGHLIQGSVSDQEVNVLDREAGATSSHFLEERIVHEVAIIADRLDITEELVRFDSHLDELRSSLSEDRVGRRLDFIVQELGREANTIGSKAQDAAVQRTIIEIKGELERIREQVQNLV